MDGGGRLVDGDVDVRKAKGRRIGRACFSSECDWIRAIYIRENVPGRIEHSVVKQLVHYLVLSMLIVAWKRDRAFSSLVYVRDRGLSYVNTFRGFI